MPPSKGSWRCQDNGDGTFSVLNGEDAFTFHHHDKAMGLLEILTDYEERLYSAWEMSMGEDL